MTQIAAKAGVHRTTVYSYFPNRDAILAACFVKATNEVVAAADPYFRTAGPFAERLIAAVLAGLAAVRNSPTMRSMVSSDELAHTHHAAERSEVWRSEIVDRFTEWFVTAEPNDVRQDVTPKMLAEWVIRICFSLIDDPGHAEYGGDEGLLRAFLPGTIAPHRG